MNVCPRCHLKYPDGETRCFVDGAELEAAPDDRLGTTIAGRYLIEAKLGEGGMATVYRARHTLVDRPVAVKIMSPQLAGDRNMRERFRREAKNAASVQHPNIIEIHDYGDTEDGTAFMVMELLDGAPLGDLLSQGRMQPARVASLGLQIAAGLARAHDFDVLHRDLKPDNVLVARGEGGAAVVKLLDFGIARSLHDSRLTNAGEIFGTPQYMAPERVTSIDAGPSADLYALGVILFEMLTGRLPFEAEEMTGYLIKHMQEPPPRPTDLAPDCPAELEALIFELLEKRPEDRPVDAHRVMHRLQPLAPERAPEQPPPPAGTPSRPISAPTLPRTTLDRWAKRAELFEQMLQRAFPSGDAPPALRQLLEEMQQALRRVPQLRHRALAAQRRLEKMEAEARDSRARLGHAVHTLAEDLSGARQQLRSAEASLRSHVEQDRQHEAAYRQAHRQLEACGGYRELEAPSEQLTAAVRDMADALQRWQRERDAATEARLWVERKQREVDDLEYQVGMLRQQLEKVESDYEGQRTEAERVIRENGGEAEQLEQDLVVKATRFCNELRPRRELGDLFAALEAETAA